MCTMMKDFISRVHIDTVLLRHGPFKFLVPVQGLKKKVASNSLPLDLLKNFCTIVPSQPCMHSIVLAMQNRASCIVNTLWNIVN